MSAAASVLVQKVWNYAHVLRDDGVSYGDYLEQITLLVFLKMAQERLEINQALGEEVRPIVPEEYSWPVLVKLDGAALESYYRSVLESLGRGGGMLGTIFKKAQNKIQDPAKLKRLISLIDSERWMALDVDVKGEIYEGLLERNARDIKSGAGQYFTPRPLIRAMVEVTRPQLGWKIADPACGTAGFLVAAFEYIEKHNPLMNREERRILREEMFYGADIVDGVVRLAAMNMYLHGIGTDEKALVEARDSLASEPSERYDLVLTNPPFGKKSSIRVINERGEEEREALTYERQDFWATTSNKQLNFVQHVHSMLKVGGMAAIVVPDNVLFEGGAGETVRRRLLQTCDVHTLLRLPTGIFYAQGVKANVLFLEKKPGSEKPWTKQLWVYDLRTNQHFTLKENPLEYHHLKDFIACYKPGEIHKREPTERFRPFSYEELMQRDKVNLDIFWLKDESLEESENLPAPEVLAQEIIEDLQSALEAFSGIAEALEP
jgi:type I restriction enzyme M protein